ncbi:ATP-binding protein [Gallaecimonas pentaromativorans]|uniref:ATP-binding protein n=1 Tax=Gallaecimonas pentaromativorans TaxID=584787 RepID=UPI003A91DA82
MTMQIKTPTDNLALRFGPFLFYPEQRLLTEDGRALSLGGRAMDMLLVLLERRGETVSKEELMQAVWPTSVVDEISVRVHIAALRRALGDSHRKELYITTLPQKGYRFSRDVTLVAAAEPPAGPRKCNLPALLSTTEGREVEIDKVANLLTQRRLLTITGSGGIGKTTVAIRAAQRLKDFFSDGIHFLDLACLDSNDDLTQSLCELLRVEKSALPEYVAKQHMLLVLDNCEHLVSESALLAESLLGSADNLTIVATSREPFRADGESVMHLGPLPYPVASDVLTAQEAQGYAAVRLFVYRCQSRLPDFVLNDDNVADICTICRRLDGLPLALELAAVHIDVLGLRGIALQLEEGVKVLSQGKRTAMKRHQTLQAALDWSYGMLEACEQSCFRTLSILNGSFSLEQALELLDVLDCGSRSRARLLEAVTQLVTKSLVEVERGREEVRYRLLDTTRSYALDKLKQRELAEG